jgi:hypothetical protein
LRQEWEQIDEATKGRDPQDVATLHETDPRWGPRVTRPAPMPDETRKPGPFHAHLDVCKRCEGQPFDLCPVGAKLLKQEVDARAAQVGAQVGVPR